MKLLFLLLLSFILFSCIATNVPKPIPIKGTYGGLKIIETQAQVDSVWDRLIDMFAQKGLSIKIIDRSSGLIISERTILPSTIELNSGALKDPLAFAITPKIYDRYTKKNTPLHSMLTGEWNVRIKKNGSGTTINVNVVNIEGNGYALAAGTTYARNVTCYECKSTGVFEQIISDIIK
jgi:hypothetical protein